MNSPFDEIINRKNTNSVKWEFLYQDGVISDRDMGDDIFAEDELLPLWVADMDFASPPTVVEALCKRAEHGVFGYSAPKQNYFDAIINWMDRRHNWQIKKEWILTAPGVVPSVNFIVQTYTEPGDNVVIQTPVYRPFYNAVENNGRNLLCSPMLFEDGQYAMDFADLEEKFSDPATKLVILCSPHNPVGRIWTPEELDQLGQLAIKHNVLVLSDEIHHDLIHPDKPFTTFMNACPAATDKLIVCTAPSKTFNIPGLKTSNVIIPNEQLREQFTLTIRNLGLLGVNAFGIVALQVAYDTGDAWLDQAMVYVKANYDFLKAYLAEHLPQVSVIEATGTYLAWIDCRALGLDVETLYGKLMQDAKVFLNNGNGFGDEGAGFVRLNLACSRQVLTVALERICRALS